MKVIIMYTDGFTETLTGVKKIGIEIMRGARARAIVDIGIRIDGNTHYGLWWYEIEEEVNKLSFKGT